MTGTIAINDLDTPTGERERKAYFTLAARYAMAGLELVKGDWEVTGQAPCYATRRGLFKPLESLEAARDFLAAQSSRTWRRTSSVVNSSGTGVSTRLCRMW